jgi:serralysin
MSDEKHWCFAWYVQPQGKGQLRAALQKKAKWAPNSTISISFLDGDPALQERVKQAALQWVAPGMAHLTFEFRTNTNQTDIRISFQYEGSWSVIGTTCRLINDTTQPTMNFGWLNLETPQEEVNRVVLHEFGHALGLIHEHQNPTGGIRWNRKKVIADLSGPPNNWSLSTIENNMFKPYKRRETNYTKTDFHSIMMYPFPESWTLNHVSAGDNNTLSETDCQFIREQYK